jgi:hypothetical protein
MIASISSMHTTHHQVHHPPFLKISPLKDFVSGSLDLLQPMTRYLAHLLPFITFDANWLHKSINVVECKEFWELLTYARAGSIKDQDIPQKGNPPHFWGVQKAQQRAERVDEGVIICWLVCVLIISLQNTLGQISLTTDMWSNLNLDSFKAVTAHFMEWNSDGEIVEAACMIMLWFVKCDHSGKHLGHFFFKILKENSILFKVSYIVVLKNVCWLIFRSGKSWWIMHQTVIHSWSAWNGCCGNTVLHSIVMETTSSKLISIILHHESDMGLLCQLLSPYNQHFSPDCTKEAQRKFTWTHLLSCGNPDPRQHVKMLEYANTLAADPVGGARSPVGACQKSSQQWNDLWIIIIEGNVNKIYGKDEDG